MSYEGLVPRSPLRGAARTNETTNVKDRVGDYWPGLVGPGCRSASTTRYRLFEGS